MPSATLERRGRDKAPDARTKPARAEAAGGESNFLKVDTESPHDVGRTPIKARKLRDATVDFTQEAARSLLALETFPGERRRSPSHVQYLYDQWRAGRFDWDLVILATAKLGNKVYHINGQHTALMRLNMPANAVANVRRIDFEVASEQQLRALYGRFDRNVSRTPGQVLKSLVAGRPETRGLGDATIQMLGAGLRLWLWGDEASRDKMRRIGPFEIASAALEQHKPLFEKVAAFYQRNHQQFPQLKRASVVAALFATFDVAAPRAEEFWGPVCDGLNLEEKDDPRYELRRTLQNSLQRVDRTTPIGRARIIGSEDAYRVCLQAWNKWCRGETVDLLRPTDTRPEVERPRK